MSGALSIGGLTIFLAYLKDMYRPIQSDRAEPEGAGLLARRPRPRLRGARRAARHPGRAGRARAARRRGARCALEGVSFGYDAATPVLRDVTLQIARGREGRAGGRHRRRQEHAREPGAALLRPAAGPRHARRPRPARADARLAAPAGHADAAGADPVPDQRRRQHRVRRESAPLDEDPGRRAARRGRALHPRAAAGLRHRARARTA